MTQTPSFHLPSLKRGHVPLLCLCGTLVSSLPSTSPHPCHRRALCYVSGTCMLLDIQSHPSFLSCFLAWCLHMEGIHYLSKQPECTRVWWCHQPFESDTIGLSLGTVFLDCTRKATLQSRRRKCRSYFFQVLRSLWMSPFVASPFQEMENPLSLLYWKENS